MLEAEVRKIQVLLVDDRGDARVDLDDGVADELDVEEVVERERAGDPARHAHQAVVLEGLEVHREPCPHRLPRLRVPEQHAAAVGDAVDRSLAALDQLHDEQLVAADFGQELGDLLEPHREAARALVQELVSAIDRGIENAEAAGARARHRLEADRRVRVAQLRGSARQLASPAHASPAGRVNAELVEERIALGLVVRDPDRLRARDEHDHAPLREGRLGLGERRQVVRGLRQDGVDALPPAQLEHGFGEDRARPGRHLPERVAQPPADSQLLHVTADELQLALAVCAQGANERRRAGGAAGGDEDAERPHRAGIYRGAPAVSRPAPRRRSAELARRPLRACGD